MGLPLAAVGPAHRAGRTAGESEGLARSALQAGRRKRSDCAIAARRARDREALQDGWCRLVGEGFDGWIEQARLWGVYPNEKVE
jgi:SH3-like domain-containing protein